jgi:preprotein translocase subunit YajC
MSQALIDLLFWIVVFVALYFLLRRLQARRRRDQNPEDD